LGQTSTYCNGDWSKWDGNITTLPGLYVTAVGVLQPISMIASITPSLCTRLEWLRFINVIAGVACLVVLYKLLLIIHPPPHVTSLSSSNVAPTDDKKDSGSASKANESNKSTNAKAAMHKTAAAAFAAAGLKVPAGTPDPHSSSDDDDDIVDRATSPSIALRQLHDDGHRDYEAVASPPLMGILSYHHIRLIQLSLFPLHYFFHYLYYTDVISTLSVLTMYYLSLTNRRHMAAIVCHFIHVISPLLRKFVLIQMGVLSIGWCNWRVFPSNQYRVGVLYCGSIYSTVILQPPNE
jgi:hypothetical protein